MNQLLKNLCLLIIAVAASISMAACGALDQPNPQIAMAITPPQTTEDKQKLYDYLLSERGITVIKAGETRTIVIASDQLFNADSMNFNENYVGFLKIMAKLIASYDTSHVAINAYTNQAGEAARAITEKQAQQVMVYLQKQGVDTRLIYAKGYGNLYPVSIDPRNSHFNRRIEIKFQFQTPERI